jgi:Sec-independent protein translocase protein TatA
MNILGLGMWELVLILVIAMVVAGPKRLLHWSYIVGRFLGQVRVMWGNAMDSVQKEIDDAGVDFQLPRDPTDRRQVQRFTQDALKPFREPMEQAMREAQELKRTIEAEARIDADVIGPAPEAAPTADDAPAKKDDASFGTWSGGKGG